MNPKARYLTKSRFKEACECPTKLYYTGKKEIYANATISDPFLAALAEGGFQVGELAKMYYQGGISVDSLDYEESERQTALLLERDNVIIFEGAIRYQNLFLRVDIIIKKGKIIELIEVKAKSYDSSEPDPFFNKKGQIVAQWCPYLLDIAFQTFVVRKALPECTIMPYLLMPDKSALCPTDGLNQKFLLKKVNNRTTVTVTAPLTSEELEQKILVRVPVGDPVNVIINADAKQLQLLPDMTFEESVFEFARLYEKDERQWAELGGKCAQCQYKRSSESDFSLASGRDECWQHALLWSADDLKEPTILDLWDCRSKDEFIKEGAHRLVDVKEAMLNVKEDGPGMSRSQRQYIQILKVRNQDMRPEIKLDSLREEMSKLTYPLHFIDFETTMVPIPFTKGRRPYEGIAFQFSHHQMERDGTVVHKGEYLNATRGVFPNYEFLRALKSELDQDNGSIFRYATHENTFLNFIHAQLQHDPQAPDDAPELQAFVESITKSAGNSTREWEGPRVMKDLLHWVKRYYYDPATGGKNSIKYVLPAILGSSRFLRQRYSRPVYGVGGEIAGTNFLRQQWVLEDNGKVKDPYKLLAPLFEDVSKADIELLTQGDELRNGSAALTAYARMQFTEMDPVEYEALRRGLLRYCELDTLAMVMIFEGWMNWEDQ